MISVEALSERILDEVFLHSDISDDTLDKLIEIGNPNPGGDLATEKMKPVRSKLGLKNDDKGGSKIGADEVNRIIEEAFSKRGL